VFGDLVLRTAPNWTAVGFLALLGMLHLSIAIPAFVAGHWEGYLSLMLGTTFIVVSCVASRCRYEMSVFPSVRQIRLRSGVGPLCFERCVSFSCITAVRLTLGHGERSANSRIELLCPLNDIECPPTKIPRQEALFLALAIAVPLIKVSDENEPEETEQRISPTPSRYE
jgi:hypothetical protein